MNLINEVMARKPYISVSEAAYILGCHENTVRNLYKAGVLAGIRHNPRGKILFPKENVSAYLNSVGNA